jgi:hypothetical protein
MLAPPGRDAPRQCLERGRIHLPEELITTLGNSMQSCSPLLVSLIAQRDQVCLPPQTKGALVQPAHVYLLSTLLSPVGHPTLSRFLVRPRPLTR